MVEHESDAYSARHTANLPLDHRNHLIYSYFDSQTTPRSERPAPELPPQGNIGPTLIRLRALGFPATRAVRTGSPARGTL
jgi:hypothetical protein